MARIEPYYLDDADSACARPRFSGMASDVHIGMVKQGYAHPTQEHQPGAMERLERFVSEQGIAHAERAAPQTSYAIQ